MNLQIDAFDSLEIPWRSTDNVHKFITLTFPSNISVFKLVFLAVSDNSETAKVRQSLWRKVHTLVTAQPNQPTCCHLASSHPCKACMDDLAVDWAMLGFESFMQGLSALLTVGQIMPRLLYLE